MASREGRSGPSILDSLKDLAHPFLRKKDGWNEVRKDLIQEFLNKKGGYVGNQEIVVEFLSCEREEALSLVKELEDEGRVGREEIGKMNYGRGRRTKTAKAIYLPNMEQDVKELSSMDKYQSAVMILEKYGGSISKQKIISDELNWSDSTTVNIVNELEDEDVIEKINAGRNNLIALNHDSEDLQAEKHEKENYGPEEIYSAFEEALSDFNEDYLPEDLVKHVNSYIESEFPDGDIIFSEIVEPSNGELWAKDAPGTPYVLKQPDKVKNSKYALVEKDPDYSIEGPREQNAADVLDSFTYEDLEKMT